MTIINPLSQFSHIQPTDQPAATFTDYTQTLNNGTKFTSFRHGSWEPDVSLSIRMACLLNGMLSSEEGGSGTKLTIHLKDGPPPGSSAEEPAEFTVYISQDTSDADIKSQLQPILESWKSKPNDNDNIPLSPFADLSPDDILKLTLMRAAELDEKSAFDAVGSAKSHLNKVRHQHATHPNGNNQAATQLADAGQNIAITNLKLEEAKNELSRQKGETKKEQQEKLDAINSIVSTFVSDMRG